jgi:hypothetical protein
MFERLLGREPSIQATCFRPTDAVTVTPDVWIFDGWMPPQAPSKPALYLDPPAPAWLGTTMREETGPIWSTTIPHPVLDGVDPVTVDVSRARMPTGPLLTPIAHSARGNAIVSVIERMDTRAVVVGFGTEESTFGGAPAFPVLIGNAIDWLAHPVTSAAVPPGAIELPLGTAGVLDPDGRPLDLQRVSDRVLARLERPGLYFVTAGGAHGVLAMNAGDAATADLRRTSLADQPPTGNGPVAESRAWWRYAVVLACGLLLLECWTWQRRITV